MQTYSWKGENWSARSADEAESNTGVLVPISDLLEAIHKGDAKLVSDRRREVPVPPPSSSQVIPTPPPSSTPALKAGDMDEAGKARALAKIEHAKTLGVTLPKSTADGLFFDVGTTVMDESWQAERKGFEKLPLQTVALPKVIKQIESEDRANYELDAWTLRMSPTTGRLGLPGEPTKAWSPTERGFSGFTSRAGIGAIPQHWPTDIKAHSVNALVTRFAQELDKKNKTLAPNVEATEAPRVKARVQRARGALFACVSPSYGEFDGDRILEALHQALPRDARVNVAYNPDTARGKVEIITLQEEKPVVGEPFKTSFTVGWDDTGGGSIWGDGGLWSARCLNLTRIWTSVGAFAIRHAGSTQKLAERFEREFERIAAVITQFAKAYGHAASEELTTVEKIESHEFIQGIYRSLIQRELVPVRGRKEDAAQALTTQFYADENQAGITRAGIANGITRYAHRVNQDVWLRDDLERSAGRLLWSGRPVKLDYLAKEAA